MAAARLQLVFTCTQMPRGNQLSLPHVVKNENKKAPVLLSNEKNAQRDANTARALAGRCSKVRTPPARPPHTHRQDRLQYTAPQLASAQCNCRVAVEITQAV